MVVKDHTKERKLLRVPAKAAGGGQIVGALRTNNQAVSAVRQTLESMKNEVKRPLPDLETLKLLAAEMRLQHAEQLRSTAESLKTHGSAVALEKLQRDKDEIALLADEIRKESAKRVSEIDQQTDAVKELSNIDKVTPSNEDAEMTALTREELDAKLDAIESRMDGRVASIEGKIDGFMGRLEEKFGRLDDRMTHIATDVSQNRNEFKSLKTTIITTGIGSVLAIVFGVAAFNATVLSNMLASFESGKNTATALTQATEQMKQTQDQLKAVQERLDKQTKK